MTPDIARKTLLLGLDAKFLQASSSSLCGAEGAPEFLQVELEALSRTPPHYCSSGLQAFVLEGLEGLAFRARV